MNLFVKWSAVNSKNRNIKRDIAWDVKNISKGYELFDHAEIASHLFFLISNRFISN